MGLGSGFLMDTKMSDAADIDFYKRNIKSIISTAKQTYNIVDEQIQYHLGIAYDKYLSQIKNKYSRSKSFFTSNQAVDLYDYYVSTSLQMNSLTINETNTDQLFKHSIHSVISGTGGCGKSVFMRHLLLDSIKSGKHTPIYIELRDMNDYDQNTLDELIISSLRKLNFDLPEKFIEKLKKNGHIALLLDGYDEVNHDLRKNLIKDIKKFVTKYQTCPIVISTRPDDIFKGIDEFTIFQVAPLTLELAKQLISKIPFDNEIKNKFTYALEKELFSTHTSFLSNPLLLSIMLLTYSENANIPKKLSVFYSQAYEALFHKHDANKGAYKRKRLSPLDIQDFSNLFSLFCLQTYDKRIFKTSRLETINYIKKSKDHLNLEIQSEDFLHDLISAACLLIEDGLDITYTHRSFQEYFVAKYILNASAEIQEKLMNKYVNNIVSDNVINLLFEMNQDLIEQKLYAPKLEKIFSYMNVKAKITSANVFIFMQKEIKKIHIEKNGYGINFKLENPELYFLDHVAEKYASKDIPHEPTLYEELKKFIPEGKNSTEIQVSKLKPRSALIQILMKKSSWLSVEYFQSIHNIYKEILKKQKEKEKNLSDLIGL